MTFPPPSYELVIGSIIMAYGLCFGIYTWLLWLLASAERERKHRDTEEDG